MKKAKWFVIAVSLMLMAVIGFTSCGSAATPSPVTVTVTNTETKTVTVTNTGTVPTTQPPATSTTPPPATTTVPKASVNLNGAGATFPQPLYTKWFSEYAKITGVQINYQGVGSGAGINQITAGTVDFGASDGIMSDAQVTAAAAAGGPILHIPMTAGAVAVIYNLPNIPSGQLKLTGDVLANIYLKNIKKWNDPTIASLNPGVTLPDMPITVVHRSDGSGTTFIFTNYLSKVSQTWLATVGNANSVPWIGDVGAEKNAGVAGVVAQTSGAIGYVELAYAIQNNLFWVLMRNAAGNYQAPSLAGTTAAMEGITLPDDMKIMITNSTNPDAYPICGFTWILAYVNQTDKAKGETLVNMLWWAIHDGQQYTADLQYAALSAEAVAKAEKEILSISYQNQPLITIK